MRTQRLGHGRPRHAGAPAPRQAVVGGEHRRGYVLPDVVGGVQQQRHDLHVLITVAHQAVQGARGGGTAVVEEGGLDPQSRALLADLCQQRFHRLAVPRVSAPVRDSQHRFAGSLRRGASPQRVVVGDGWEIQASPLALRTRRSSGTNSSWLTPTPTVRMRTMAAKAPAMSLVSWAFLSRKPRECPRSADWTMISAASRERQAKAQPWRRPAR